MRKEYPNIAIFISGRGSNMHMLIKQAKKKSLKANIGLVFSNRKEAQGLKIAKECKIPIYSLSSSLFVNREAYEKEILLTLKKYNIDWIVCAGYMLILTKIMIHAYPKKIINIHPSLLPSFPGLRAQKQALDYGVLFSGCTIHYVNEGMDTGEIITQELVTISKNETENSLAKKILAIEHKIYWRTLNKLFK